MKQGSPTLEGFRAIFRRPSFGFAEVAWRWSLACAGVALVALAGREYLDTLPVTDQDLFLLGTRQPGLMWRALMDVFHGSALRFWQAAIVLGLGFAVAWIVVAALGRAATLKALLKYLEQSCDCIPNAKVWRLRSLVGLNFLRTAVTLAAVLGGFGAMIAGGAVTSDKDPSPGSAALVFLAVLLLVSLAWLVLNWFLSLASLFVVAEGEDTFGSIGAAAGFCRDHLGPVVAVSFWFGSAHLTAFAVASFAAGFPLAFVGVLPGALVLAGIAFVTLLYFAVADWLYIGRLAGYAYILQGPELIPSPAPIAPYNPNDRVDPGELILCDLPLPAES